MSVGSQNLKIQSVVSMNEELKERVIVSLSPDLSIPKEGVSGNSDGKANASSSPALSSTEEKPLPNYLRASTGSCHDFCKYGRKHVHEAKERRPIRPAFLANSEILAKARDQVKVPSIGQRKKKSTRKLEISAKPGVGHSNPFEVVKQNSPNPKEFRLSDTPTNELDSPSAGMMLKSLSLPAAEQAASHRDHETLDESMTGNPMTPLLIDKCVITYEVTPSNKAEESSEDNISMNLETPTTNVDSITSVSSEEPVSLEEMMVPRVQGGIGAAETTLDSGEEESLSGQINMKLNIPVSVQKATVPAERSPANRAKGSSGTPLSSEESTVTSEHSILPTSVGNDSPTESRQKPHRGERQKKQVIKLKSALQPVTGDSRKSMIAKQMEFDASGKPAIIKKQASSPVKKTIASGKLKVLKQNSPPSVDKPIVSATARSIKLKVLPPPKKADVSSTPSISLRTRTSVASSASPSVPSEGQPALRNKETKVVRSLELPKTREDKTFKPPRASTSPKPSVNRIPSFRFGKYGKTSSALATLSQEKARKVKDDTEKVKEKTLYVIEPKSGNKSLKPIQQRSRHRRLSSLSAISVISGGGEDDEKAESSYTQVSGSASESGGTESKRRTPISKGEDKRGLRRSVGTNPEEKIPMPHKLRFRRGKVVDPQSENSGPRRLRFRKPRPVTVNQNAEQDIERSLGNAAELDDTGSNEPKTEAPTVVLRHQDQQEKKDTQGLFNHVIEETASKLAETRKSKVKALVGAFETVISLQESKVVPLV